MAHKHVHHSTIIALHILLQRTVLQAGYTPLHVAKSRLAVEQLVGAGAPLEARTFEVGMRARHAARWKGVGRTTAPRPSVRRGESRERR